MIDKDFLRREISEIGKAKDRAKQVLRCCELLETGFNELLEKEIHNKTLAEEMKMPYFEMLNPDMEECVFHSEKLFEHIRNASFSQKTEGEKEENESCFSEKMRDEVVEFEIINSDIYYFRLPELVRAKEVKNNKIHAQNDEIIRKIMVRTVKKTFENLPKKPELFKEHTLLFVHHYNGKSMRDIDNISLKKPVDALNGLLVYDDNMDFNNIFQVSERDEKRYTQLFVIRGRKLKDLAFKMLFEMTGRR